MTPLLGGLLFVEDMVGVKIVGCLRYGSGRIRVEGNSGRRRYACPQSCKRDGRCVRARNVVRMGRPVKRPKTGGIMKRKGREKGEMTRGGRGRVQRGAEDFVSKAMAVWFPSRLQLPIQPRLRPIQLCKKSSSGFAGE